MEIKQIDCNVSYIDSREVAEMVGKTHTNLLRDIKRYCNQMEKANEESQVGEIKIDFTEFFKESSYKDSQNKTNLCYNITKKGCEFIAHKLTGTKGTAFTARYINRFHEMESQLATVGIPEETILQIYGFIRQQSELNQRMMNRLEMAESRNYNNIYEEFYWNCIGEKSLVEKRKEHLYGQVAEASELYGQTRSSILHTMYCALEKKLGIDLDSYKSVYCSETGNRKAGMVEVIAANDRLYKNAVDMNEYVLKRF